MTARGRYLSLRAIPICLALIAANVTAQSTTTIARVELSLNTGTVRVPIAGTLYKSSAGRREPAAEVSKDGRTDKVVQCSAEDRFEADTESMDLTYPVAPVRVPCGQVLAFKFKSILLGNNELPWRTVSIAARPAVLASYARAFEQAGEADAEKALSDAALSSLARALGDEKLTNFVYRDPMKDYRLVFNAAGADALREKQLGLKIDQTGKPDPKTLEAFATFGLPVNTTKTVSPFDCSKTANAVFSCIPADWDKPKRKPDVRLPQITYGNAIFSPSSK